MVSSRPPLASCAYHALPLGRVEPRGWLRRQLELSAAGLTGRLPEIWEDVGPRSGWLGGDGECWERGPYYARGLVALAHALGDVRLLAQAEPWIEWTLASQRPDGFFGPAANDDWWARMPMLEALCWHHEATGDPRVLDFLARYFAHQLEHLPARPLAFWGRPRGGDNLAAVLWLYDRTGEARLLELADLLHAQTSDWIAELGADGPPDETFEFGHGVNRAMGFKEPALWHRRSGDARHLAVVRHGWQRVMLHHGQIQGLYSGDEFLHGTGSTQGTEFCTIAELLSSFETVLAIAGEKWIADAIERIAYNALPAILTADHTGHQYFQQPNQIQCSPGGRAFSVHHENDLLFGPVTGYGCCAANFHMAWPRFAAHVWMLAPDGAPVAMVLAPSAVETTIGGGRRVRIVEETDYPFGGDVRFQVHCDGLVRFPLRIRIPGWAAGFSVSMEGAGEAGARFDTGEQLLACEREWRDGDTLLLRLSMPLRVSRWEHGSAGIERGPLVYALAPGEEWRKVGGDEPFCDWEVHPTTPWSYGLAIDPEAPEESIAVETRDVPAPSWARDGAPTSLLAPARALPEWTVVNGSAGPLPESPVIAGTPLERIRLIPFGCARLRISMFPLVER